jgi:hypothetical protein
MDRTNKRREREIGLLIKEPGAKDALDKLCTAGCEMDGLVGWLFGISTYIYCVRTGLATSRYAFPSAKEITKLSADIEQLAIRIERANADPIVSPAVVLGARTKPRGSETDRVYKRQIFAYHILPQMLRKYAEDVRASYRFAVNRIGPKRLSFERYLVQQVLEYVQDRTGQPHYESVQRLLESAFRVTAGDETPMPKLLESPDALKQLWARSLKYGFRKKKKPESSHPILKLKL